MKSKFFDPSPWLAVALCAALAPSCKVQMEGKKKEADEPESRGSVEISGVNKVSGWQDASGNPIVVSLSGAKEGERYECRTGPASVINSIPFASCASAYQPAADGSVPEGSYVIEARVVKGDDRGAVSAKHFYVHNSLNGRARCAQSLPDSAFFAAVPNVSSYNAFGSGTEIANPFVKLDFDAEVGLVNSYSLGHVFKLSDDRKAVLIQREFASRFGHGCAMISYDKDYEHSRQHRHARQRNVSAQSCDAIVALNGGPAACLQVSHGAVVYVGPVKHLSRKVNVASNGFGRLLAGKKRASDGSGRGTLELPE